MHAWHVPPTNYKGKNALSRIESPKATKRRSRGGRDAHASLVGCAFPSFRVVIAFFPTRSAPKLSLTCEHTAERKRERQAHPSRRLVVGQRLTPLSTSQTHAAAIFFSYPSIDLSPHTALPHTPTRRTQVTPWPIPLLLLLLLLPPRRRAPPPRRRRSRPPAPPPPAPTVAAMAATASSAAAVAAAPTATAAARPNPSGSGGSGGWFG